MPILTSMMSARRHGHPLAACFFDSLDLETRSTRTPHDTGIENSARPRDESGQRCVTLFKRV